MNFKILLIILLYSVSNLAIGKDNSEKKFWIKHHYECVFPYLEEIKSTTNFERKKNKNALIKVIDNLEPNYRKVYSNNRVKHYIKQAEELKNRTHKLYQDQIWHDKDNTNPNLYVPEYCFTMLQYQLKKYYEVDIEKYFSDEDYVIDGFKSEATLAIGNGLAGALSFMTDSMYSVVSLNGYRNSLKNVLELTYPITYAQCFENINYGDSVYKQYYSSIISKLDSEFNSKIYQERLNQDKKQLDITYDVLINHTGVSDSDVSKDMIRVNEKHEFFKLKERQLSDMESSINSANKLVNEISNFKYMLISFMSKTIKNNPNEFNKFKEQYVCSEVARVHKNNGYLDSYLSPEEMKKYHRSYYKSLR